MSHSIIRSLAVGLLLAPSITSGSDEPSAREVVATFAVQAGVFDRLDTPVSASLEGLEVNPAEHEIELREMVGERREPVPSQLDAGLGSRLWWILSGKTPAGSQRTFELVKAPLTAPAPGERAEEPPVAVKDDGDAFTVSVRGRAVLRYRHTPVPPPAGESELYARSGFIHPIWSPDGEVLTTIQPRDHLHHFGLWNPWVRTEFEGRKIDFWNLGDGQGTVRFKGLISTTSAAVFGGLRVLQEHVDLSAPGPAGEKVVLNEDWQVRVWNADPAGETWLVDFVTTQSCASESPLAIKAYRYQGFGFRATAKWDDQTATLRTSEGKDKSNGHKTRARWFDIRGLSAGGTAGILFMSHPGNFNHPEHLRVWPIGANDGKENVFLNFNPAQDRDWVLEPGRTYTRRYRLLVYDGEIGSEVAERFWSDLAHPPRVTRE